MHTILIGAEQKKKEKHFPNMASTLIIVIA